MNNELDRREFLKAAGLASTSFVIGISLPIQKNRAFAGENQFSHHYLAVGPGADEFVFTMDKAEMGQGVITGQLTMLCEELDLNPRKVKVIPAHVAAVYGTMGGMQITGGSTSTSDRWKVLREAGAHIRHSFLLAAAKKWAEPVADLTTEDGFVKSTKSAKIISYNQLAAETKFQKQNPIKLKDPKNFIYIGKPQQKADGVEKSMGLAQFGIDFQTEGLLSALVIRSPTFGGKLKSFDKSQAESLPGIKHVVQISSGVAIVGEKYWQVQKARNLIAVEWDKGKNAGLSSDDIQQKYKQALESSRGKETHSVGDVDKMFSNSDGGTRIEAQYELPYLAHSAMEPMNASAFVQKDRVDVWVPTQSPTSVRNEVAEFLGISREKVYVHNTKYLGGGFGRRSTVDYPMEAVELSKLLNKPIKVIWSREDDTRHSPMRPISRHHMKGLVKEGKPVAWEHRLACESIMQSFIPSVLPQMMPGWLPTWLKKGVASTAGGAMSLLEVNMVTGEGAKIDYDVPNQYVGIQNIDLEVPIHFWRSVGHSYNGFVVETFIDEMAHAAGRDPYEFRREQLQKNKRAVAVLDKVAEMADWKNAKAKGQKLGIAYHYSFKTFVAQVAEVEVIDSEIKVKKVYCAVDCGVAVNPDIVKEQIVSGIIYGLSASQYGRVDLVDGAVRQSNFHDYPIVRMGSAPDIEVQIIESNESPTGVGEPGLPPIAPAVGNAVFSAVGKRLRSLPFKLT